MNIDHIDLNDHSTDDFQSDPIGQDDGYPHFNDDLTSAEANIDDAYVNQSDYGHDSGGYQSFGIDNYEGADHYYNDIDRHNDIFSHLTDNYELHHESLLEESKNTHLVFRSQDPSQIIGSAGLGDGNRYISPTDSQEVIDAKKWANQRDQQRAAEEKQREHARIAAEERAREARIREEHQRQENQRREEMQREQQRQERERQQREQEQREQQLKEDRRREEMQREQQKQEQERQQRK